MDTFFWVTIVTDLIHATFIISLGSLAVWLLIRYYNRIRRPGPAQPASGSPEELKIMLPLKLQACERLILFLERITPEALVMRVNSPGMSPLSLQTTLLKTVREEYEYNLSQQLYVSREAWEQIRSAKEEVIMLINTAASGLSESADTQELMRRILTVSVGKEKSPIRLAIDRLKAELTKGFFS